MKLFSLIILLSPFLAAQPDNLIDSPNWICVGGAGQKLTDPTTARSYLSITNTNEQNTAFWRLDYPFEAGQLYEMSLDVRVSQDASITAVLFGSDFFNKDIGGRTEWQRQKIIFAVPHDSSEHFIRLGMWQSRGTASFSNVYIQRLSALPQLSNPLGDGETIHNDDYQAHFYFTYSNTNFSRCLAGFLGNFNSFRWDLYEGDYVIYKHDLSEMESRHKSATLSLNVNYYQAGVLIVEAGRDGAAWERLGTSQQIGRVQFVIPPTILPSSHVYIRFRIAEKNARMQIDEYRFQSQLNNSFTSITGQSVFARAANPGMDVVVEAFYFSGDVATAQLRSTSQEKQKIKIVAQSSKGIKTKKITLPPNASERTVISLPETGDSTLTFQIFEHGKEEASTFIESPNKPYLNWDDYGKPLTSEKSASFWWTDGVRKIGRYRSPPSGRASKSIELSCARNEYEPAQLVITPRRDGLMSVSASGLYHKNGHVITSAISLFSVDYVDIQTPTDYVGVSGPWPDPLPAVTGPLVLKSGENQPIWILINIPEDAAAGNYEGWIETSFEGRTNRFKIRVHVWDFCLPKKTHLQTAFGFYPSLVARYHNFADADRLDEVLEKYFINFSQHRISPFDPFVLSPISVDFDSVNFTAHLDFSKFDKAYHRYIDELGFNSFRLPLENFASGTYHASTKGKIGSFKHGSPEYNKMMASYLSQLQSHLQELDALDKAYIYWFDEPDPGDYEFIRETMSLVKSAAPKLVRMLTEQPEQELFGAVDLWCPKTPSFEENRARERRNNDERLWWYICTFPKAPYVTLFIDHYAVELRTWIWQSWKYNVDGILVWAANYWTSENAFPWPKKQNPWTDPMSYRSGDSVDAAEVSYWGNGDGRFIYPPKQVFESAAKIDEEPVSSIRWEMLREGLEDYEYLWLLRSLIGRLEENGGNKRLLNKARALLNVPENIAKSMTEFSKRPEPIFEHRRKVAEMIQKLEKLK